MLEVYEVDPETGLRVTTRSPTTKSHDLHFSRTTTQLKSIEPVDSDTDYYTYQDDYVYEPTTSQAPVTKEETEVTTEEIQEYVPTVQTSVKTVTEIVKTTEEPSTVAVTEEAEEIHETADKHSTTTLPSVETTFSYDDTVVDVDRIDLDIHNEISDQLVEESQRVETTWNGVVKAEDHTIANTRLSSYQKNVDTSIYGADTEYNISGLEPQVNEHSKPTGTGSEHSEAGDKQSGDTWHTGPVTQPKVREYLEIDRSEPIARVEEVPITESRDYSEPDIIYDVTKDGFDDDVDTFSVPVAVAFNVPETEAPVVIQTSTVSQEVTTSDVIETETSTAPVIETTTLRETVPTTTVEEVQSSTTTTEEQSTTTFAEEVTTTASPTTEKPESTFNKFYNLIHRNRNNRLEQVYLGSRPTTTVRTTTSTAPTTQIIDLTKSAHKVPNSVWSHFERSREDRTTTKAPVIVVEEENTTTMSYNTTSNTHVVADLPKPSEHESEVLVEKQVLSTEEASYSGFVPRRKTNKEKWRKSLLASKKKYNKPKFPRVPLLPFAPSHQKNQVLN